MDRKVRQAGSPDTWLPSPNSLCGRAVNRGLERNLLFSIISHCLYVRTHSLKWQCCSRLRSFVNQTAAPTAPRFACHLPEGVTWTAKLVGGLEKNTWSSSSGIQSLRMLRMIDVTYFCLKNFSKPSALKGKVPKGFKLSVFSPLLCCLLPSWSDVNWTPRLPIWHAMTAKS